MKNKILAILFILFTIFLGTKSVSAHEAYVIPYDTFWSGLSESFSLHAFSALENHENLKVTSIIVISVLIGLSLNFAFRRSRLGQKYQNILERFSKFGPQFVRISIAIAFFFSAYSGTFLGPELKVDLFPYASLVRIALYAISIMIAFGIFTELAGLIGVILYVASFFIFGPYVLTYLNYFGELLVLLIFGMRVFSLDKYFFGPLRKFKVFEKYETLIVRILYGLALAYAAITVKLLHPNLTIDVIEKWNLTQFHWLFPSDPLLVTLGAGIVECVIGLFIIFGFEMRLTIFVSLFYITLSLMYFRELVWPHLLLYGISFNLLVQPETFTIDHILFKEHRKNKRWWKRPLSPHSQKGKSS